MTPEDFAGLPARLTFTVDVEEHRAGAAGTERCRLATGLILDRLAAGGHRGTFFVVGETAARAPALVREIAARGHEVASHALRHVPLARLAPAVLEAEARDSRRRLEDLAGRPVQGFRAPFFSLTKATPWAPERLAAAGFAYSSSVLPGRALAFGFPGAPAVPFRWPCGLLEIPCPVARLLGVSLPCLGGMYLRYLPPWRLRRLAAQIGPQGTWTYCHPYEFDLAEPFGRVPGVNLWAGFLLWINRRTLVDRLAAIMAERVSVPFADCLAGLLRDARPFPGTPAPATEATESGASRYRSANPLGQEQ